MRNTPTRPAVILLVEDNIADQRLTIRALKNGKIDTDLHIVDDGQKALDFLRHQNDFGDTMKFPKPDLILLDINLPKLDGKQVLREIRADEKLKIIPVVMLTTSTRDRDVIDSYKLGVNAYISKPVNVNEFFEAVQQLENFWFKLTILPPNT